MGLLSLTNLHDVVKEWIRYLGELVRNTVWDHDDIAFRDLAGLSVANALSAEFVRCRVLRIDSFTAGDECCGPVENVDDVRIFGVDFGLPRLLATTGVDHIVTAVASVQEDGALRECLVDLAPFEIRHWNCWVIGSRTPGRERAGSSNREFLILIGCGCTTYTDSANNLAIDHGRNAADERSEILERCHHGAAFSVGIDQFLEETRRLLEHDGSASFPNRDIRSGRECAVEPLKRH